jgi:hypothetical protein
MHSHLWVRDGILGLGARPGLETIKPDVRVPALPPVVLDLAGNRKIFS